MSTVERAGETQSGEVGVSGLQSRSLGTLQVVFFIVGAAAPLAVTAGALSVAYLVTGNRGLPFLFIPLAAILAVFAVGYAAMSRHVTDAGAFYTYVVRGLGRMPGLGAAFIALVSYNALQIGIYGLFGTAAEAFFASKVGIHLNWYWWCLFAWVLIGTLGVMRIDLNARVLAVLLCFEILVVAVFDFAVVASPGPQGLSAVGFSPHIATHAALGATMVFCAASFIGFEGAAIYSEESKDPKRTVARATFIALALIAVLYALSSWLMADAIGPNSIVNPAKLVADGFTTAGAPDPTKILVGAGTTRLGAFWGDAAALLFATSLFAALLSFHNAVARYAFALSREGIFPRAYSRTNRFGAPAVSSVTQSLLAFMVVGAFVLSGKDPVLTLFTWLSNLGTIGILFLMALASFAVVFFFRRQPDHGLGVWRTAVAPLVAGLALLAVVVLGVMNFNVLITGVINGPTASMTITLLIILFGFGVAGVVVAAVLRQRSPSRYARIGAPTQIEVELGEAGGTTGSP